jgi:DNA-binding response OmpR family regulator
LTAPEQILVVEDEPAIRELLAMILRDEGFAVETAAHGRAGLAKASLQVPDVVILDLMMPGMTGWEFIEVWQADSATKDVPIVVISAENAATTVKALRVRAFLRKPFDLDQLLAVLSTLRDEPT